MTPTSKNRLRTTGIVAVSLAAGALLSPIGLAGAQDDDADAPTEESTNEIRGDRAERHAERRDARQELLESLGIDADALEAGREADMSLAEIAAEAGVSEADLVAAIEAEVADRIAEAVETGRLTQEVADEKLADLSEEITERVNTPPSERPERGRRGHRAARFGAVEALEELGLTAEEIRAGHEAGQSLAETAEANGVSEADLVAALVAEATERAEAAVENGRVDADDVAERLDGIEERIAERVNAEPGDRPNRPGRGGR